MAGTGAAVPSDAILDLKENAKTLDEFISSNSEFVVGRITTAFPSGKNIRTLTGINAVFDAAQAGQFVADSEAAADRSETAADVAMAAGWVYTDVASGEAARVDGDYFWVVSADDSEVLELWLMGATAAADTGKRTPSVQFVNDVYSTTKPKLNIQDICRPNPTALNGADVSKGGNEILIPDGATGASSLVMQEFDSIALGKYVGMQIEIAFTVDVPAGLSPSLVSYRLQRYKKSASSQTDVEDSKSIEQLSSTRAIYKFVYTVKSDDWLLRPFVQLPSGYSQTSGVRTLTAGNVVVTVLDVGDLFTGGEAELRDVLFTEYRETPSSYGLLVPFNRLSNTALTAVNGATQSTNGFTIPSGSTGNNTTQNFSGLNSYFRDGISFGTDPKQRVRVRAKFEVAGDDSSIAFTATPFDSNGDNAQESNTLWQRTVGSDLWVDFNYLIEDGVTEFGLSLSVSNSTSLTEDVSVKLVGFEVIPLRTFNNDIGRNECNESAHTLFYQSDEQSEYYRVITVDASGGADFTSIKAASDSILDSSAERRYLIQVAAGVYTDVDFFLPGHTDLVGNNWKDTWLKGYLPPSTDPVVIETTETIWINETSTVKNMRITCQNMRYPIHSDSSASNYEAVQNYEDLWIQHFGNDEADAFHSSAVWGAWHAFGCGTHSGEVINTKRCRFESPKTAFYFHTREDFDKPSHINLDSCELIVTRAGGRAMTIDNYGSGQPDTCTVTNCLLGGLGILYRAGAWFGSSYPSNQAEVQLRLSGSTPVSVDIPESGFPHLALLIEADSDSIAITGDAASVLFGTVEYRQGAANINAIAWSSEDVSGSTNSSNSLSSRLGDRTGAAISFTVNGTTVTFNSDYSGMSNDAIVNNINTQLGVAATARLENVSLWYRPIFADCENTLFVIGSNGVQRGKCVAHDGNGIGELMTDVVSPFLFAGIALEDALPDSSVRVRRSGFVHRDWVGIETSMAVGSKFVSDSSGQLVIDNNSANPLAVSVGNQLLKIIEY